MNSKRNMYKESKRKTLQPQCTVLSNEKIGLAIVGGYIVFFYHRNIHAPTCTDTKGNLGLKAQYIICLFYLAENRQYIGYTVEWLMLGKAVNCENTLGLKIQTTISVRRSIQSIISWNKGGKTIKNHFKKLR